MIGLKDLLLQAGVVVTLVLGLVNLYFNVRTAKRSAFVNTVTAERIKWIAKVRENVSALCAACDEWMVHRTQASTPELQRRIEHLRNEILLQLNPRDIEDLELARLVGQLPSWSTSMTQEDYGKLQSAVISAAQGMLKREWDKVKDEAVLGDLRRDNGSARERQTV